MLTTRIAFTSCVRFKPGQAQTGWRDILAADPDYLFLLGDQIYMDFGLWPFSAEYAGRPKSYSPARFARVMRDKYERQWSEPNFAALLAHMRAKNGFYGVWDDHDFAWNNAYGNDASLPADAAMAEKRDIARGLFHEFMACAPQPPEVYGCIDVPLTRVIFLDNRYHATPLDAPEPALMGPVQMDFLRRHLQHEHPYTLICAGLSLSHSSENWSRYTAEFAEFRQLLQGSQGLQRVLYLGGDVHKNAFGAPAASGVPPCYEVISSGLCVNYLGLPFEFDRRRNWTLLTLQAQQVLVEQFDKSGVSRYSIAAANWQSQDLGRQRRSG